jgi:hypothetical protein
MNLMEQHLSFQHQKLYDFWSRSVGLWQAKLVKVMIEILTPPDRAIVTQLHQMEEAEFGIRLSWEYSLRNESGQMIWCVTANHPDTLFADQGN